VLIGIVGKWERAGSTQIFHSSNYQYTTKIYISQVKFWESPGQTHQKTGGKIGENGDSALFLEEKIGRCPHFPRITQNKSLTIPYAYDIISAATHHEDTKS